MPRPISWQLPWLQDEVAYPRRPMACHFNRGRVMLSRRDTLICPCSRYPFTNRSRQRQIYVERGLYQQCVALRGLCRPDRPFIVPGQRDSAIDMWFQATLTNSWRPPGPLQADIISILFRRHPSRSKLAGSGALLRGLESYEMSAGRKIEVILGGGWSQFQLGRGIQPIRQRHQQLDTEFFWHRLLRQTSGRGQRFHLNKPISDRTSVDMYLIRTKSRTKAPHLRTRIGIQRAILGMTHFLSPGLQLRMGIESESRRHGHRLTYLATMRVRRLSSDIIMQPRAVNNVKVVQLTMKKFPAVIRLIRHHKDKMVLR